jgi:hypothetical protein
VDSTTHVCCFHTVGSSCGDAPDYLVRAFVVADGVAEKCKLIVLRILVKVRARFSQCHLGDHLGGFQRQEVEKHVLPMAEVCVWTHHMNIHFHRPVDGVHVEMSCLTSCAINDNVVDGRAVTSTCGWSSRRCRHGGVSGWAMREQWWSMRRCC